MVSERKEKKLESQIHLIIISRDCWGPIGSTYCHKQNLSSKIQEYSRKIAWYAAFKPPYLLMHETIFCQKTKEKFLASTSNLREEENLVHLGRFLHFSQKVVGVTLNPSTRLNKSLRGS